MSSNLIGQAMNESEDPPVCCDTEMLISEFDNMDLLGSTNNVYYCPDCGKMLDVESGEVLDAGCK